MSLGLALALAGLGLVTGGLIGCVGIGGVLLVPALVYLWGFEVHAAVATSMWTFVFGGAVGAVLYGRKGSIDWRAAGWLCGAAMPAALVGTYAMAAIPGHLLELAIAIFIAAAGADALRRRHAETPDTGRAPGGPALAVIGAVTGFVSALTGTGGPVTLLPILVWLRLPMLAAVGLSQAVQFPVAMLASIGNLAGGRIDLAAGSVIAGALVVGVVAGARAAHAASTGLLSRLVALVLVATGGLMVARVVYGWLGG